MEVREFVQKDLQEICGLIRNELGYPVSISDLADRIAQMQDDGNYRILVACVDESIVGFIGFYLGLAFEIAGRVMCIIALAVSERHQGCGIGTALVQRAENLGKSHQATAILVSSGISRSAAHTFYERQGFKKKGYSFIKQVADK